MNKICCFLLYMLVAGNVSAQYTWQANPDTLKAMIARNPDDTIKVWQLNNLADLYAYNNPDSALPYAEQMLRLAIRLDYKFGIGHSHAVNATAYNVLGNYPVAMQHAFEAAKIFKEYKFDFDGAIVDDKIAEIYYEIGNYREAIRYQFKVRRFYEGTVDTIVNNPFWNKTQALMYSNAALSSYYLLGNMPDSALYFARATYVNDRKLGMFWSNTPLTVGNALLRLGRLDSALFYYRLPIKVPARNDAADINVGIATVFEKKGDVDSAVYFADMALDSAAAIRYTKAVMRASELLSQIYQRTDPVKAIEYYKISNAAKDSLYNREKVNEINSIIFGEERRTRELEEANNRYQNKLRLYSLIFLLVIFLAVGIILYRNNRHRAKAYSLLQNQKRETDIQKDKAEAALQDLKAAQAQLIQSEKMASLGELTAGIAHEIQNPLNFVNNFSEVNSELLQEIKGLSLTAQQEALFMDVLSNNEKITHHGKRADAIVKGMLQHSRSSTGQKEPADINALCDEYLRLSYHGLRAKDKTFNATWKTDFDPSIGKVSIVPQDIGRVIMNLLTNAFYAVNEKAKGASSPYDPSVSIATKKLGSGVEIEVTDNGNGIPQSIIDKIFQPFFTTKPTGQGTGLGLSLSYDIVKSHGGELKVTTLEGEGSTFTISLPNQ